MLGDAAATACGCTPGCCTGPGRAAAGTCSLTLMGGGLGAPPAAGGPAAGCPAVAKGWRGAAAVAIGADCTASVAAATTADPALA